MFNKGFTGTSKPHTMFQPQDRFILPPSLLYLVMQIQDLCQVWISRPSLSPTVNFLHLKPLKHISTGVSHMSKSNDTPECLLSTVTLKDWDAQRYDASLPKKPTGQNESDEQRLNIRYPVDDNYKDLLISEPTTVVDRHGKIVLWYLPGALSNARQVWLR
jgi:hypothetical protein